MHEARNYLKSHQTPIMHLEPYYRGDLGLNEKEIEAFYGICNAYFLLENGNILEVVSNYDYDKFKGFTKYCGICNGLGCTVDDLGVKVWNDIVDRAVKHFTNAVKDNITINYHLMKHKPHPMSCVPQMFSNCFIIREKDKQDECVILENDIIYKNEEQAFPDVVKLYFDRKVVRINPEFIFGTDKIRYYNFAAMLKYCSDNNIDISDLIQIKTVKTCIDRRDVIIYVSKKMLTHKHPDLKVLLDEAVETYIAYAESKKLTVNVYDKTGTLIKTETGFIGDYIDEAGIEDRFGISVLKLGSYKKIDELLDDNKNKIL